MGASARSVGRIPDQGIDIVIVLLGGAAEIDVDAARPEFRRGDGERDIILARTFAGPDPALAEFNRPGEIGRDSCWEGGCHYVLISVVAGDLHKKTYSMSMVIVV